ncbi:MAG: S8 family serine peptidase [Ignavibacteriae bacterium]|nr:S8 family serine peptidase [Ignavibacteriota bacterium]
MIPINILFGQGNNNSRVNDILNKEDPNIEIFVELKTPPLALQNKLNKENNLVPNSISNFNYQDINTEHSIFIESVNKIMETLINEKFDNSISILGVNKIIINGVALTIPKSQINQIRNLPAVKSIYYLSKNRINEINRGAKLENSDINQTAYSKTGITKIKNLYGLSGKKVKVAVLDTGIDYNLDCLGGGFGNKVIGGYDFNDNDDDPMDKEGHGTAVASILAGNSADYQGVAPDALLLAYNIYVGGFVEEYIELQAMEKAYNDSAKIIVVTSAATIHPFMSVLSKAVENLAKLGVITIASAGNKGDNEKMNIVSPAAFNDAIAVGASTVDDEIASYSSRGPNYYSKFIKPDIVAPAGVYVASPDSSFYIADGTSISAPFLAGIIALMIEHNPNMSVNEIRSRLLNSAKDIGYDIWSQGCGRVDAYKALKADLYLEKASYCIGYDDASKQEWIYRDTLIIYNKKNLNVSVKIKPTSINGITSTFESSSTNINANSYITIPFSIKVDNNLIPYPSTKIPSYDWEANITSYSDTVNIPFAFFKDRLLIINFSETPGSYLITNMKDKAWSETWTVNNPTQLPLENGNYDLITQFNDGSVIYNNFSFSDFAKIEVNKNVTLFPVNLTCYDETQSNIIDNSSINAGIIIKNKSTDFGLEYETLANSINLSSFPDGYEIIVSASTQLSKNNKLNYYCYKFNSDIPINDKLNFTSTANNLKTIHHIIKSNSLLEPVFANLRLQWVSDQPSNSVFMELKQFNNEWYSYLFNETDKYRINEYGYLRSINGWLTYLSGGDSYKDSIYIRNPFDTYRTYKTDKTNIDVIHNGQAYIWLGNFFNESNKIYLTAYNPTPGIGFDGFFFKSQYGDGCLESYNYSLYKDNILVKNGSYNNSDLYHDPINISPGKHMINFENTDYQIDNIQGNVSVNSIFDTQKEDKNPPYFLTFGLYSDGQINAHLQRGIENKIIMNINDDYEIDSINIELISDSSFYSVKKNVNSQNFVGSFVIPDTLKEGIYNLKLFAIDKTGNTVEYNATPFFIFGNVVTSVDYTTTFTVNQQNKIIKLNWYTKVGNNIKEFEIERMLNAGAWQKINNILNNRNQYEYTDDISKIMSNTISYRLKEINIDGTITYSSVVEVTGVIPLTYRLDQNYPNPFNPTTKISYTIPKQSKVTLTIYDILGNKIKTLVDKIEMPGIYNVIWDGNGYSSGIYFYRIQCDKYLETKKMLLLR